MQLKWKSQHFLGFPFLLSLVSVLGIKKFHISTSTLAIILKIQIKKYFLFFSIFSHFLGNQTVQQIQRNVISSSKLSWNFESETNRNSSEPKKEKNERILINFSILKLHKFKINKKNSNPVWCLRYNVGRHTNPKTVLLLLSMFGCLFHFDAEAWQIQKKWPP